MTTKNKVVRKLRAIFSADVHGYSLLMADDETHTIETLKKYRQIMFDKIQQHSGRVVDSPGDNILAEFASAVDAVGCAVDVQIGLEEENKQHVKDKRMEFRIGINIGDIVQDNSYIYGSGVNITARIEKLAEPSGICISRNAYDHVKDKLGLRFKYIGEHEVKNIKNPVWAYKVLMASDSFNVLADESLQLPEKPSIAVLPFANMSGDIEQEYFSDGITEDIITALSRSPWLFVISRSSSFTYRETGVDVRKVSKELGVRYVLEGSVRKAGNKLRITAQLIDGTVGNHIWAEKYDGELEEIFDFQDQITQKIVATILTQISIYVNPNIKKRRNPDLGTWEYIARGWKKAHEFTEESFSEAEKIAREAIAFSPSSCEANAMLAIVFFHQVWMGYASGSKDPLLEAYDLAQKAIKLDESVEYAHWIMGLIQLARGEYNMAIEATKRTIELNPNFSLGYGSLGTVLNFNGEPDEAIKNNKIAIRINPKDPSIFFRYSGIAIAHFLAGRYSKALQWANKSINRNSNWRIGHVVLIASLVRLNLFEEAKEAMDNCLKNDPNSTISELRKALPFKNPEHLQRFEESLQKAGLPE